MIRQVEDRHQLILKAHLAFANASLSKKIKIFNNYPYKVKQTKSHIRKHALLVKDNTLLLVKDSTVC
jgi:hypothetical protein